MIELNLENKKGKIKRQSEEEKRKIQDQNTQLANEALRVIAVGYREFEFMRKDVTNLEENLIFVGLIGMIDPPRQGVKEAVKTCKKAGIKTVMITGDHIATATAIAKELGILEMGDMAITGAELDNISDNELTRNIASYSVFARVTPEHKVRIVKAWQKTGAVVAMTGDGVNDSPALKNADIGIAMGKGGTDVAKNASDMVLMDDNFVTIVQAIRQGRNIFDNIKKAIHFLISTNIGEITTIFIGLLLGLQSPLLAIQLLWINLVTDSLPAIALGLEKEEKGIITLIKVIIGIGLISGGYYCALLVGDMSSFIYIFYAVVLVIAGIYFLYDGLIPFVINKLSKNKKYATINAFMVVITTPPAATSFAIFAFG